MANSKLNFVPVVSLRRIMFEGIRPYDWWMLGINAVVLVLVTYQATVMVVQQITGLNRKKRLRTITGELRGFISSGKEAQNSPDWNARIESTKAWIAHVEEYLAPQSEKALEEFRWGSGPVSTELQVRLDNLHRISQNAENYF